MSAALRPRDWPLAVKVPLLVVVLMIGVAAGISHVVIERFVYDQERNLRLLTSAYLDGLSALVLPALIRSDVWETYDALERARGQYQGVNTRYAVVVQPTGTILAASDPHRFPVSAQVTDLARQFETDGLSIDEGAGRAWLSRSLQEGGIPVGRILAEIDISDQIKARRDVMLTLVGVNAALALVFALIGYIATQRMVRPLGVLTRHVDAIRDGTVEPIKDGRSHFATEFDHLFGRFNAMAHAVAEREALAARLAEEEKYALLGKLASGMAHEVNNPIAGMLNAVDTLQTHGHDPDVRRKSVDFLKRGIDGIRSVVRATLVTYKGSTNADMLTPGDLDDLPFLVQHETGVRRLDLVWRNELREDVPIPSADVRQITLNLLLNACAASPAGARVQVSTAMADHQLRLVVEDRGPGLPQAIVQMLGPMASLTSPPAAISGLGLWTTARSVKALGGRIHVDHLTPGTRITVLIPLKEALDAVA